MPVDKHIPIPEDHRDGKIIKALRELSAVGDSVVITDCNRGSIPQTMRNLGLTGCCRIRRDPETGGFRVWLWRLP